MMRTIHVCDTFKCKNDNILFSIISEYLLPIFFLLSLLSQLYSAAIEITYVYVYVCIYNVPCNEKKKNGKRNRDRDG